jgi:hypothetical protein
MEKVVFTTASSEDNTLGTASLADEQNAEFDVFGMTRAGQSVTFTYTIENQSDVDVTYIDITVQPERTDDVTGYDTLFTVNTSLSANEIAKNTSITATVIVTLNADVTEAVTGLAYTMSYTASTETPTP